jgi:hypothetical protein
MVLVQAGPVAALKEKPSHDLGTDAQFLAPSALQCIPLAALGTDQSEYPARQSLPAPDLITVLQHFNI